MKPLLYTSIAVTLAASALTVAAQTPAAPLTPTVRPVLNGACMQSAVEKRDNALIAAVDAYHSSMVSALKTRRDALKTAWGNADRKTRRAAIRTAWKQYRTTLHTARQTLRKARVSAWQTFATDRRACRASLGDDGTNAAVDITL